MIPRELERICLKAMSRRASERYTTASDMAEDLRGFLKDMPAVPPSPVSTAVPSEPPPTLPSSSVPGASASRQTESRPITIVPRGLRSFDEHDADAFLELLPGPRDRDGLPDSLRFWKQRIEETDPDKTFQVGLTCLRPFGVRQIVADQGGAAAASPRARDLGLRRSHGGRRPRSPSLLKAVAKVLPGPCPRTSAWSNHWLSFVKARRSPRAGRWRSCWTSSSNGCTPEEGWRTPNC